MASRNRSGGVLAVIALVACTATGIVIAPPASRAATKDEPRIVFVPAKSTPPVPPGLKVTCMASPNRLNPSKTCPVVKYLGITTWAYSFIDNRVAMALVSYDASNKVIGNVTKNGARYVWEVIANSEKKTVQFFGQSNQSIEAAWTELGR